MNLLGIIILLAGPALGIAWIILEFKGSRAQRLTCGILALVTLTVVTWFATHVINQLNYNAWYGSATKGMIDETIRGIEAGKSEMVLRELKAFQSDYHPTYENRASYRPLAEQAAERMKKANPQQAEALQPPAPAGPSEGGR
jgi:hypothetical protein